MKTTKNYRDKYAHDIYFDKKWREKMKKSYLRIQKEILETSDFTLKPVLKKEYENRELESSFLGISVIGLSGIKKAEEFYKDTYFKKCTFELYKMGKSFVFKSRFYKPFKNVWKTSYLVFPSGFPENGRKKAFIIKNEKYSLKGFTFLQKGTFRQKIYDFGKLFLTYKSGKEKWKFELKQIKLNENFYWATLSSRKI